MLPSPNRIMMRSATKVDLCCIIPFILAILLMYFQISTLLVSRALERQAFPSFKTPANIFQCRRNYMPARFRSEERRVGKEGRSRWSPYHSNKKKTHDSVQLNYGLAINLYIQYADEHSAL